MKIIAVIPAKAESSRLPDKNWLKIGNKTLVELAAEFALTSKLIDKIIISTDKVFPGNIYHIPKELSNKVIYHRRSEYTKGDIPITEVYKEIADIYKPDYIICIQPDHPDRNINLDSIINYVLDKNLKYFFTTNKNGKKDGAVYIFNIDSIDLMPYCESAINECTNIHTKKDFNLAKFNFFRKKTIKINSNEIGGNKTFIVAEAANNHMCNMTIAKTMILNAKLAGADAIKLQTYKAERLVTEDVMSYWGSEKIKQIDYYKRLDKFGYTEYKKLLEYANNIGITLFSTPFDEDSAKLLNSVDMKLFKIPSMEINNLELLSTVAKFKKPIILSTGASTIEEIEQAIDTIFSEDNFDLMLLACSLSYPTENKDANLKKITALKEKFPNFIIGYSDHTYPDTNMIIPSLAVSLGAKIIEKHYTYNKNETGSGHFFSVDFDDLKKMVYNIRLTEQILGENLIKVHSFEQNAKLGSRKSIMAAYDINAKTTITRDMITLKRPGIGISPDRINDVIGKTLISDIKKDQILDWKDLQ